MQEVLSPSGAQWRFADETYARRREPTAQVLVFRQFSYKRCNRDLSGVSCRFFRSGGVSRSSQHLFLKDIVLTLLRTALSFQA